MVYVAAMSDSQRVIRRQPIIKEFGPNIQHIYGVENIVAYIISRIPYTPVDKYYTRTLKAQCCRRKLYTLGRKKMNASPAKYIECSKRTSKTSEEYKLKTNCIINCLSTWLIQART